MYSPNLSIYDDLKNDNYQAPSIYWAAVKNPIKNVNVDTIRARLEKVLQRDDVDGIYAVTTDNDDPEYINIVLHSEYENDDGVLEIPFFFKIKIFDNHDPEQWAYEAAEYRNRNLLEDERMEMQQTQQIVECLTYLENGLTQNHLMLQLAVLDAIAGECYAVQDLVSSQFLSGTWLAEMAQTYAPPSMELCYIIHVIVPEHDDSDDYWLHTHGLLKFGLPELEIMQVSRTQLSACQNIITTLANRLISEPELWQHDDSILIANSTQGELSVRLWSWQDALSSDLFNNQAAFSGCLAEREADDIHTEPSMVIFADQNQQIAPLATWGDVLSEENHMMMLLPNSETARMYYLAAEKLPLFLSCFARFPPQEQKWAYMMKINCISPSTEENEHMWFIVQEINDESVTAELVNEPFNIPEMQSGETYTLPLDDVSDWVIYAQPLQTRITPDDVFKLRRFLNAN